MVMGDKFNIWILQNCQDLALKRYEGRELNSSAPRPWIGLRRRKRPSFSRPSGGRDIRWTVDKKAESRQTWGKIWTYASSFRVSGFYINFYSSLADMLYRRSDVFKFCMNWGHGTEGPAKASLGPVWFSPQTGDSVQGPSGDFSVWLGSFETYQTAFLPFCFVSNGPYKFDKYLERSFSTRKTLFCYVW